MQKVYTKIESIVGNVVTVRAPGVRNGDLALVGDSYANVIKLDKDIVSLQVFAGAQGVSTTDPVRFLGRPMMVSFSDWADTHWRTCWVYISEQNDCHRDVYAQLW